MSECKCCNNKCTCAGWYSHVHKCTVMCRCDSVVDPFCMTKCDLCRVAGCEECLNENSTYMGNNDIPEGYLCNKCSFTTDYEDEYYPLDYLNLTELKKIMEYMITNKLSREEIESLETILNIGKTRRYSRKYSDISIKCID